MKEYGSNGQGKGGAITNKQAGTLSNQYVRYRFHPTEKGKYIFGVATDAVSS